MKHPVTYFKHLLNLLLLGLSAMLQAQDIKSSAISVKSMYGIDMLKSHSNGKRNFLYGVHVGYDQALSDSQQDWIRILIAKRFTVGLLWSNLSNMHEIAEDRLYNHGQAIGGMAAINFQLFKVGPVNFLFSPGLGLTYITETINTQPETSTVGSNLNIALAAELSLDVPVRKDLSFTVGTNVLHYSNGGIRVPNGGINTVNASLGLRKSFRSDYRNSVTNTEDKAYGFQHIRGSHAELAMGLGYRSQYRSTNKGFYRTGVYAGYNYFFNQAVGIKTGLDMVYYHSVFDADRHLETFQYYGSSYDRVRLGISTGLDVAMNRFVATGMAGRYIHYNSYYEDIKWYWTSGLRYYITKHMGFQSTLYMHRTQADFISWGMVVKI